MRRFLTNLCLSLFAVFLLNSCSETSSGNREFLQLFTATKDDPNRNELYAAYSDFTTERVSGEMVKGGNVVEVVVSPDGTQVAYVADQEVDEVYELYVVSREGGNPVKVSGTMVAGGDVQFNSAVENTSVQWSPDGSLISFIADKDTDSLNEVYVTSPDGSVNRKVSGNIVDPNRTVETIWSPDNTMLAYYLFDPLIGEITELFVGSSDGSGATLVSGAMVVGGSMDDDTIQWSPNSQFISYVADQETDNLFELFVSTPDGVSNTKVSGVMGFIAGGVAGFRERMWSPDSSLIAYFADQETQFMNELYVSSPDGLVNIKVSGVMAAGEGISRFVSNAFEWSPDSSSIVYIAFQDDPNISNLYSSSSDGTTNIRLSNAISLVTDMEWSDDGNVIAYGANEDTRTERELYVVNRDGSNRRKVSTTVRLSGSGASGPEDIEWSPDGNRISYVYTNPATTRIDELHVANVESNESTRLTASLIRPRFDTRQSGEPNKKALWSPDGSRVTYISRDITTGVQELFSSDFQSVFKLSGRMVLGGSVKTMH